MIIIVPYCPKCNCRHKKWNTDNFFKGLVKDVGRTHCKCGEELKFDMSAGGK